MRTLAQLMKLVMRDVHAGSLPPNIAHTMTALANISIKALEKGEIEERLEHLEKIATKREA